MDKEQNTPDIPIDKVVVIKESGSDTVYKVSGDLNFEIDIKDEKFSVRGVLKTDYFIGETEVELFETWRYLISGAHIEKIFCDSSKEDIMYSFTADSFEIKG